MKKFNNLSDLASLVDLIGINVEPKESENTDIEKKHHDDLRIWLEKKHRAGKSCTVIKGFLGPEEEIKELCRKLKQKLGTGGSVKSSEIILQGDFRDKSLEFLKAEGYKAKKAGG